MAAYRCHPEIGDIYPVASVKVVVTESNVNGFLHPPCVPVSLLGEALYPFPVGEYCSTECVTHKFRYEHVHEMLTMPCQLFVIYVRYQSIRKLKIFAEGDSYKACE